VCYCIGFDGEIVKSGGYGIVLKTGPVDLIGEPGTGA
jgi:hypothetical protein